MADDVVEKRFFVKQGDTRPSLVATLTRSGVPVVLPPGTVVRFHMRSRLTDVLVINEVATIVNNTTGKVEYIWVPLNTATRGIYVAEWEATFPDGGKWTFPNNKEERVIVEIGGQVA